MNKIFLIGFIFIALLLSSCGTTVPPKATTYNPEDIVRWTDTTKLTWDDFAGEPSASSSLGSEIIVLTPAEFQKPTYFNPASVKIECFMIKAASWVNQSKAKKQLLAYNQTLFDIYELSARKLRQRIANTDFKITDPVGLFNTIHSEHNSELAKRIAQYRSETEIGSKTKNLMEWSEKIAGELSALEEFKSK